MTIELDKVIENLPEGIFTVELYEDGETYWANISTEDSTGAEYKIQSVQDLADSVKYYLLNYYTD